MSARWAQTVAAVLEPERFETRLEALLALARAAAGAPDCYLYLLDASERHLHLAHSIARPAGDPTRAPAGPLPQQLEGGAEWSAPMPPLELARSAELERERTLATPVGTMHALPMRDWGGGFSGLIEVGPVGLRGLRRRSARRLRELAGPLGFALQRAREEHALAQRLAAAEVELQGSRRLAGATVDLDRFVGLLLDLARNSTGARSGFVAIVERPGEAPVVHAQSNMQEGFAASVDLSPTGGLFDWTPAIEGEGGVLALVGFEQAQRLGLASPIAVPMLQRDEPLGIFALDFGEHASFDERTLELLSTFAEQVRLMLDNARVFSVFSGRYMETVKGLAEALDSRRVHTRDHHARVSAVAMLLGRELGGDAQEQRVLREAGLVHDVGLAGASGLEGGSEIDLEHPTLGASLIEHLPIAPAIAAAVATHHEWHDGWGFPRGIDGEQIPHAGRVLALAEFLVEMSTGDAVRDPWGVERIVAELRQRRGSQFDPEVAGAALRLAGRGALELGDGVGRLAGVRPGGAGRPEPGLDGG